ncbi:hypothetical protein EV189_2362 [Motilibacter rhizosphaerae]|uniref:Tetratricopeptide repeat protein n=1 Tax=Motilibacter rhizosphaerae TaxID=598652 RepID=A0A4Q7NNV8_9ACTN|nr:hypothetical protein [Motilibacter rhizosphaerae]RZS86944.1 hypothetical protein EV189_2362 [Motilibacter rhizosphaerae]
MRARTVVGVLVALVVVYAVLLGRYALALMTDGGAVGVALGTGVLGLPVVGLVLVGLETRFGLATQRLGRTLEVEGGLPVDDLPRRPSGRPERAAADARFAERRAEVEQAPGDWRRWYRLALAYDDAGDRRRARSAMRRAVALEAGRTPPS